VSDDKSLKINTDDSARWHRKLCSVSIEHAHAPCLKTDHHIVGPELLAREGCRDVSTVTHHVHDLGVGEKCDQAIGRTRIGGGRVDPAQVTSLIHLWCEDRGDKTSSRDIRVCAKIREIDSSGNLEGVTGKRQAQPIDRP